VIIREYKSKDREAVEKCIFQLQDFEYRLRPDHYWEEPAKIVKPYFDYLVKHLNSKQGKMFVAEIEEKIVGFVAVYVETSDNPCVALKQNAYVADLVVLQEYRKSGFGKLLLEKASDYAKEIGMQFIHLDVTNVNPATDFYRSQGYYDRAIRMEKKL
jgi:ribosomal protein S18 acetylase RimI-like enzyme